MQSNNIKPYLFQVHGLNNRYNNTVEYVTKTLVPKTSNQTVYEVIRDTNNNVYLYMKVAPIDYSTLCNYISNNTYLKRVGNNVVSDEVSYKSIQKKEYKTCRGQQTIQNNQFNMNNKNMMMHHNMAHIHNNNQINKINNIAMMQQHRNIQMNNNQINIMNNINLMNKNQMMMQNNINQQNNMREKNKQQENIDKLRLLNPKNCKTQHISWFFNKETILNEANKNRQTIHPANDDNITQYMNWFSKYINDMYVIINYSALGKNDKKKCWQDIIGQNFDQITESTLTALANTDFLNKRSRAIDGSNLIEDINEAMKYFAECSLQIYQRKKNINDIIKIVTVYNQLRSYLNANPKAFVDRGILGFGTDRDNEFREIVNKNVKVKNLKDLIVGVIELIA